MTPLSLKDPLKQIFLFANGIAGRFGDNGKKRATAQAGVDVVWYRTNALHINMKKFRATLSLHELLKLFF